MNKELALVSSFRRRMLPLIGLAGLVVAGSAPAAFYAQKRGELVSGARATASRAGRLLLEVAAERPRLWQYDAAKLSERLTAEGLQRQAALVIRDARGAAVPITLSIDSSEPARRPLLWAREPVVIDGRTLATIWVGVDTDELRASTAQLAVVFVTLALLLSAVLYLLPVRAIRVAERRIAALMGRLTITLQEDDRRRIARDLHDGAGQALTAARLRLLALRRSGDSEAVDAIASHVDEALDEIRRSTSALLPPALADLGLLNAVARHCKSFGEAAGLSVECELSPLPVLPAPIELACYRIIQEALNNTARHAGATRAWVRLVADEERLCIEIGDNGVGLGLVPSDKRLDSIRERARLIGGTVVLSDGRGARIEVQVPLGEVGAA